MKHRRSRHTLHVLVASLLSAVAPASDAVEDLEFVAEHLPEVAMDNRYATLPLWNDGGEVGSRWQLVGQFAMSQSATGNLTIGGPMFSVGATRALTPHWALTTFGFFDDLRLQGNHELRPLQTLFAPTTPIARPSAARYDGLDGEMRHFGAGFSLENASDAGWLGDHRWQIGALWERVALSDYRATYSVLSGPQTGMTGTIDFDATYIHATPFVGLGVPRDFGNWLIDAHALFAWPLPRRGFVGHITGPGFDLHGDTADVGNGKHFGDPSVTLGLDVTYRPAHLTLGFGTLVSQRLLEPFIHKGIETNWLLSLEVTY